MKAKTKKETVLITGGSSGIGKELSRLLFFAGYDVLVVSLVKEELKTLQKEISQEEGPGSLRTLACDLTGIGSESKVSEWVRKLGQEVDILVNNAGFGLWGKSWELPAQKIDSMIRLNSISLTLLSNTFAKQMTKRRRGYILNIASTASLQPLANMAAYAASKAYVVNFSEALREELSPYGVQVGIMYPGTTRTNFLSVAGIHKEGKERSPLGNLAYKIAMDPKDVAKIAFSAIENRTERIVPGGMNQIHYYSTKFLPNWVVRKLAVLIFKKE